MATTETRTGFRLPWSQDHTGTDEPTGDTGETVGASESSATAAEGAAQETERPDMIDATPGVLGDTPQTAETDADGRIRELAKDLEPGRYELVFWPPSPFFTKVEVEIELTEGHYHVPLLVSPYGCATYRGS